MSLLKVRDLASLYDEGEHKLNLTERANQSLRRGHDRDDDDATEPHSVAARMSPSRRRLGTTRRMRSS